MNTAIAALCRHYRASYAIGLLLLVFFNIKRLPLNDSFIGGTAIGRYFFHNAAFIRDQLLSFKLPTWNPYYYGGHPFLANPQTVVLYPATTLFALLPLPRAFNLDTLLHFFIAELGMYRFVAVISQSHYAAMVSAIVYRFNSCFMGNPAVGHLIMIPTAALSPWVFYAFEKAHRSQTADDYVKCAALPDLQIFAGEPQNSFYSALLLTAYAFARTCLPQQTPSTTDHYAQCDLNS